MRVSDALSSTASFPDGQKAATDLKKFADENEDRLYKLLKAASDEQTDLKTLVKINVRPSIFLRTAFATSDPTSSSCRPSSPSGVPPTFSRL